MDETRYRLIFHTNKVANRAERYSKNQITPAACNRLPKSVAFQFRNPVTTIRSSSARLEIIKRAVAKQRSCRYKVRNSNVEQTSTDRARMFFSFKLNRRF